MHHCDNLQFNKIITVHIIRHGEREDEAIRRQRRAERRQRPISSLEQERPTKTISDFLDPPLTDEGYRQAMCAFQQIRRTYDTAGEKRRLALFASPLRRTVGTALMISACDFLSSSFAMVPVQVGVPPGSNEQWAMRNCIPIIVLNGLCDCAAAVKKMGGAARLVQQGLIPCADQVVNDGSLDCPFAQVIRPMLERSSAIPPMGTKLDQIQFFRIVDDAGDGRGEGADRLCRTLSPLSPAGTAACKVSRKTFPNTKAVGEAIDAQESFLEALDRAVLWTLSNKCDTAIVVSHREGIRDLLERCGMARYSVVQPYCCIATFQAEFTPMNGMLRWTLIRVSRFEDFDEQNIPTSKENQKHRQS